MPRSTNLTDEHKTFIVRRLAAYESLSAIQRGLAQEFGITVPKPVILYYDPESRQSRNLSRRWRDLFWKTRSAFREGLADVGANYPLVRIFWRGEMAQEMWAAGQHGVANAILDSIAKEAPAAPDESETQGHFGLTGGPLTATVNIVHRQEPRQDPAPAQPAPAREPARKSEKAE
jgi:hypothetical protein